MLCNISWLNDLGFTLRTKSSSHIAQKWVKARKNAKKIISCAISMSGNILSIGSNYTFDYFCVGNGEHKLERTNVVCIFLSLLLSRRKGTFPALLTKVLHLVKNHLHILYKNGLLQVIRQKQILFLCHFNVRQHFEHSVKLLI